jgi:hypothetical protein
VFPDLGHLPGRGSDRLRRCAQRPDPSRSEDRAIESLLDYRCEALILLGPSQA